MASCWCMFPVMVVLETQRLKMKVSERAPNYKFVTFSHKKVCFIASGPYEMGGVAMSHKKAGNEESVRRARANLKDVHWCVKCLVFCQVYLLIEHAREA